MDDWLKPDWPADGYKYVCDWRKYISKDMRNAWDTFTEDQKFIIFDNSESIADAEEWE